MRVGSQKLWRNSACRDRGKCRLDVLSPAAQNGLFRTACAGETCCSVAGAACLIAHVASHLVPRQCIDDPGAAADSAAQSASRLEEARVTAARERAADYRRAAVNVQAVAQAKVVPLAETCRIFLRHVSFISN